VALEEGESAPASTGSAATATTTISTGGYYGATLPPRKEKTVFLVKFAQSVLARDSQLN
jgi:hypothetical protein